MAAHLEQPELRAFNIGVVILARAGDMRGGPQTSVDIVGPAVVGAPDCAAQVAFFLNQYHATVTAGILEHINGPVMAPNHKKRHPGKIHRHGIAAVRHITGRCNCGPVREEQGLALLAECIPVRVMLVRQSPRRFDRLGDTVQRLIQHFFTTPLHAFMPNPQQAIEAAISKINRFRHEKLLPAGSARRCEAGR